MQRIVFIAVFAGIALVGGLAILRTHTATPPTVVDTRCITDCTVISDTTVTTSKNGVTFEFPKSYIKQFDQTRWVPESNRWENELQVKLPSMAPFTREEIDGLFKAWDKTGRDRSQPNFLIDLLTIRIRQNSTMPVAITATALEAVVTSRYGTPKPLAVIAGIQEYGDNSRALAYRDTAGTQRFADGMPAYIFCAGKPLAPAPSGLEGGCLLQLTWPDGLEVDLRFNRAHLPKWRQLHDNSIKLLRSFIVAGNLPSGSLLKLD